MKAKAGFIYLFTLNFFKLDLAILVKINKNEAIKLNH